MQLINRIVFKIRSTVEYKIRGHIATQFNVCLFDCLWWGESQAKIRGITAQTYNIRGQNVFCLITNTVILYYRYIFGSILVCLQRWSIWVSLFLHHLHYKNYIRIIIVFSFQLKLFFKSLLLFHKKLLFQFFIIAPPTNPLN